MGIFKPVNGKFGEPVININNFFKSDWFHLEIELKNKTTGGELHVYGNSYIVFSFKISTLIDDTPLINKLNSFGENNFIYCCWINELKPSQNTI